MVHLFSALVSPLTLLFFTLFIGHRIGRITVKGVSLGLSATLIVAVLFGALLALFPVVSVQGEALTLYNADAEHAFRFLSSFGTALFISSMGIGAGKEMRCMNKVKLVLPLLFGCGFVFCNYLFAKALELLDRGISSALLFGIFCGAMTSTPGLAVLCEKGDVAAASVGYSCAYVFGVMGIVLFVQCYMRKVSEDCREKRVCSMDAVPAGTWTDGMAEIACIIMFGYILGKVPIPIFQTSLGSTGGILCVGMGWGRFAKRSYLQEIHREFFRQIGLLLFFVGTGIPAGTELLQHMDWKICLYAITLSAFPLLIGVCLIKVKLFSLRMKLSMLCAGMTSSPAYAILDKERTDDESTSIYSVCYTSALLTMLFCMRYC